LRPDHIGGKNVIDASARILGDVYGIEFDETQWKVTHLCVHLSDWGIETLGCVKPRFLGKVIIDIPTSFVKSVSDVVTLNVITQYLKDRTSIHD
jgi:sporulation protein YlmC with PRC-barrel domain